MPAAHGGGQVIPRFQSAPAGEGGRCAHEIVLLYVLYCFNPRPPVKAGGAVGERGPATTTEVSIPRPPVKAGGAGSQVSRAGTGGSFQSAPAGEGGRCHQQPADAQPSCFNPRPPVKAGGARRRPSSQPSGQFQSAPAGEGGRCRRTSTNATSRPVFNPRPPVKAGGALKRGKAEYESMFQSAPAGEGGRCCGRQRRRGRPTHVSIRARR